MQKHCCEANEKPRHVSDVLSGPSVERLMTMADEIQEELAKIGNCPAPCEDGTVLLSPPSIKPLRSRCPLLSSECTYGAGLEEKLKAYLNRVLLEIGVPRRHIDNFEAYFETPALMWASRWRFSGFLVLCGGSGVGKSFGAAWAVREYLRNKISDPLDICTWNRAAAIGEQVMWDSANRVVHDRKAASAACRNFLLVMDDFGREGDSPTRRADIGDVISARYDAKLPTVLTTELTFADIIGVYGRSLACKIAEDEGEEGSGGMIIDCGNDSVRLEED